VNNPGWTITRDGSDLIVASAIHAGHELRKEIVPLVALDEGTRLREEDPFTERWLSIAGNQIDVAASRFEVDLNRPRELAVYVDPEAAWGLEVWTAPPAPDVIERSLATYDDFYRDLGTLCDEVAAAHGKFVVIDLHSYNHRRRGPDAPVDDPEANPEINIGTGSLDRDAWAEVVEAFAGALLAYPFDGGHLDVRENVRFKGGYMSRWINGRYAGRGCTLAVEVKKIYMDEWSGEADESVIANLGDALRAATIAVREMVTS
jgi:N-formylglutamate amidohydrolase